MGFGIKGEEAKRLARQLAELTGESLDEVVTVALRERLARLQVRQRARASVEELLAIGRRCRAQLRAPVDSQDHGEMLYDERGLPK